MLAITRREGEEIVVGDPGNPMGVVRVVKIKGDRVVLVMGFPRSIDVNRREVADQSLAQRRISGSGPGGTSPVVGGVAPSPVRGGL